MAGLDSQGEAPEQAAEPPVEVKETPSRRLNLKMSFRTPKKQDKDKNEPSRFLGEGVSFKAKLIGILEVSEARGDRMCQEALADLKMAIRAAGEHKQRININIAIDGLRLRDEKTGDCLYHHPVHKISFIAQDMTDSRAFGYIFGSPDTGHRFFGIKTDKAASQVVIAMRDLFQVVFELKKKEIELAKQHIEQQQIKLNASLFGEATSSSKNGVMSPDTSTKMRTIQEDSVKENGTATASKTAQQTSEVIADLLDLEFELNSIQQGIHQMERITPSDPFGPSTVKDDPFSKDPFGDSFATSCVAPAPKLKKNPVALLPPPPSAKESSRSSDPFSVPPPARQSARRSSRNTENAAVSEIDKPLPQSEPLLQEKLWFDKETESLFEEGELVMPPLTASTTITTTLPTLNSVPPSATEQETQDRPQEPSAPKSSSQFDVFTELDPLGTGRSKPYIDRKDFFQELKNPPKKVLKDLVTEAPSEATAPLFQANFDSENTTNSTIDASGPLSSCDVLSSVESTSVKTNTNSTSNISTSSVTTFPPTKALTIDVDPFADTDPFDKTDPFAEDDFTEVGAFPSVNSADPFYTGFADFTTFSETKSVDATILSNKACTTKDLDVKVPVHLPNSESSSQQTFHGPLRVSLPPEKATESSLSSVTVPNRQTISWVSTSPSNTLGRSSSKSSRLSKQTTLTGLIKLPSPKSSSRSSSRLMKQMTVDGRSSTSTQPLRLSPTPFIPSSSSRPERRSPANQGILESVTLRNRCAITPSPPIVACFPDGEQDNSSRLSGSSAELAEIVPEPPPRPATNISAIKPPPLPPKRLQIGNLMKPPPRPPHTDDHPHYDYIENYETSSSPTQEIDEIKSPPIPVPARKPRFSDIDPGTAPQRPKRYHAVTSTKSIDSDYLTPTPFPLLPPPQKKSPTTDINKLRGISKPQATAITTIESFLQTATSLTTTFASEDNHMKTQQPAISSLNITLSQLTKTGLNDLAAALCVSPGQLSNMTLQELTKQLAQLAGNCQSNDMNKEDSKIDKEMIKRDKYAALRESVDEETEFKAEFEANFGSTESSDKLEDVFQETPFDKYAVFRELFGQEKTNEQIDDILSASSKDETKVSEQKQLETINETLSEEMSTPVPPEDRYAALREISLDNIITEKDEADTSSEREESVAESSKLEEDNDSLVRSRQQSETLESPTLDTVVMKEPTSLIESTICEEEDTVCLEINKNEEIQQNVEIISKDLPPLQENLKKHLKTTDNEAMTDKEKELPLPEKEMPVEDIVQDENASNEKTTPSTEGWAKFDTDAFDVDKPTSEAASEGGASPWSSDGKDINKDLSKEEYTYAGKEYDRSRRRKPRTAPYWKDDDESEEGWSERKEDRPWRENGWSDGEPYYEETPYRERPYLDEKRGRHRRISPWKKNQRSRDPSPWEQETKEDNDSWGGSGRRWQDRSMDEDEDEDEYEVSWKMRPKHRGSSWDDECQRRYGKRDANGIEYEDVRKRRPSPWKKGEQDRRSSWESVSWDEEDRYSQRDHMERRSRMERVDDDYRRRREADVDIRGYKWSRKGLAPSEEYIWHEQSQRKKHDRQHRYYRDRSRESPWEDDYSEQGEEESPRFQTRKRNWSKRPSSASETRRSVEKCSPGEYKSRIMEKQQHSLPIISRPESLEKSSNYGATERKFREKGGRPASREGYLNSDQEYEYWSPQDRAWRMDRELSYEQRSQTLHSRRSGRYKKGYERAYSQKSPFDDDFTMQTFEIAKDKKSTDCESDISDIQRKKSPGLPSHTSSGGLTPIDNLSKNVEFSESGEIKKKDLSFNSYDIQKSPGAEEHAKSRTSRSSSHRQSPFEDDFTPTEARQASMRLTSSISSDISDHRRSPYDEVKNNCRVNSVAEECESVHGIIHKNNRSSDDVFLPSESVEGSDFSQLESTAGSDSVSHYVSSPKPGVESKRVDKRLGSIWSSEDSVKVEKSHAGIKTRLSSLMRADSNSSLRKSESINIFARESDPFDDDFFVSESTSPHPDLAGEIASISDTFKWTKAFDSFNFDEEK